MNRRVFLAAGGAGAAAAAWPSIAEAAWASSGWSAEEKANVKVVNGMLAALEAKDVAHIAQAFSEHTSVRFTAHTDDAPMRGRAAVEDAFKKMLPTLSVAFKVIDTAAKGPLVIVNRTDRITMKTGTSDMHYLGVFFVKDGLIKEWSDYEVGPATPVKAD
jgi:limonene-1,2-epoxide hydrolase